MNILVFSWRDPKHPLAGGAEQVMHEHMKGWVKAGHKVTLFVSHFMGGQRRENVDGVLVMRYGFQYLGVHCLGFLWYVFGKHQKFDLVVDQFHGIPFFTPLYVRVPKLAVLQEVAREVWFRSQQPSSLGWFVGRLGYFLEPFFFVLYRNIPFMVGSNSAKKDLCKFGVRPNDVTIVPHGVLVKRPVPMPQKKRTKTVIFLGALARDKGIEDAIKVFAILSKKMDDFNFWILGKGPPPYVAYLRGMTKKSGIEEKVVFWGFVSTKRKFELLAEAHVLVNPSIREGWGLVNIEANSMGTPVVAYRAPGLVDSVKDEVSGLLCNANTPEELAEVVYNLLTDAKHLAILRKTAIAWSKQFSWTRSRAQSLQLIRRVSS